MTVLALDLSRREIRLAARGARGEAELVLALPREGSSRIAAAVESLLALLGEDPSSLREILVARGPGSFTGLRVAFAFASGIARANGATVRGLPLPEAIALAHAARHPGGAFRAVGICLDAGRGEAYAAVVSLDGPDGAAPARVTIVPPAALAAQFSAADLVIADPAIALPAGLPAAPLAFSPRDLLAVAPALSGRYAASPAAPLYVRKSAARERREGAA